MPAGVKGIFHLGRSRFVPCPSRIPALQFSFSFFIIVIAMKYTGAGAIASLGPAV